jgi:urease accessory protein
MIVLERTRGSLRLRFVRRAGATVAMEAYQAGALRVRFPNSAAAEPEAVLINTAGGITGGDALDIRIEAEAGAAALVTSQACEKIYKSSGAEARLDSQLQLAVDSRLDWLPQPAIVFDQARLLRRTDVEMAPSASLLALESCILGRTAMAEEVRSGTLADHWRIRRGGTLIYADSLRLDFERPLHAAWALGRHRAYANLVYVAPDAGARLDAMRESLKGVKGEAAASAWNGMLLTRFLALDGYTLIADLTHVLTEFRGKPLPRLWMS